MQKINIISKVRLPLTAILLLFSLTTCSKEEAPTDFVTTDTPDEGNGNMTVMKEKMRITIADTTFIATLEDNATTRALVEMLPLTLQMNELNGNEKYHYLSTSLPANASCPGTIHAGDILLYGSSCLVVFYKTFSTSYSYTRIGRIDHVDNLANTLGSGNVSVTFHIDSSTGVLGTKSMSKDDSKGYSLNGTQVDRNYNGIYIKNGRKYK